MAANAFEMLVADLLEAAFNDGWEQALRDGTKNSGETKDRLADELLQYFRQTLLTYGEHTGRCLWSELHRNTDCTCGFFALTHRVVPSVEERAEP